MRPVTKITIVGVRLGVIALAMYWMLIFVGTHLPKVPDVVPMFNDKIKHFTAFFGLATLLCYVTTSRQMLKRFSIILVVCLVYAAFDELTQNFIPNRTADIMDFLADAAGAGSAIGLYLLARRFFPAWTIAEEASAPA